MREIVEAFFAAWGIGAAGVSLAEQLAVDGSYCADGPRYRVTAKRSG